MVPLEYHRRWWCYMLILKRAHSEIPEKSPQAKFTTVLWQRLISCLHFYATSLPLFYIYEDLSVQSMVILLHKITTSGDYQFHCSPTKSGLSSIPLSWRILRCSITRPTWAVVSPLEKSFSILAFDCCQPLTINDVRHCFLTLCTPWWPYYFVFEPLESFYQESSLDSVFTPGVTSFKILHTFCQF